MVKEINELCEYAKKNLPWDEFVDILEKVTKKKIIINNFSYDAEDGLIKKNNSIEEMISAMQYINDLCDRFNMKRIFKMDTTNYRELYKISAKYFEEHSKFTEEFLNKINKDGLFDKVYELKQSGKLDEISNIPNPEERDKLIEEILNIQKIMN